MIKRDFWVNRINQAWKKRSLIWLSGVRRAGKTMICKSLSNIAYFDCELPRTRRMMEDPESFLESIHDKKLVIDEVHRLENPSEILKIAVDHFPNIKIIATGSSTLAASKKFKDTLTGRKIKIWLTPMLYQENKLFGNADLTHRLLHGGLPPFFCETKPPEYAFQEWLDDYWAKDIQELFRITNKFSFQRFTELILANSGSLFEATKYAIPCEVTRPTIANYLSILELTYVAHVIRPFTSHTSSEIISAPKVYGFDTGFVCYHRGWGVLRREDLGFLWEHIVLNELQGQLPAGRLRYWRTKQKHEIDFIYLAKRNHHPTTIECKWSANNFDPKNLLFFRQLYPEGNNFVVAQDVQDPYQKKYSGITVNFVSLIDLIKSLNSQS